MNTTIGIAMICAAVAMLWLGRPADGISLPWFKKAWIIGQVYVMVVLILFVMGAAAILSA
jgi:hypothetical protein